MNKIKSCVVNNFQNIVWGTLFCFPFLVYSLYVNRYAINVPMHDDFDMILGFLNSFIGGDSLLEKIGYLFAQQNEYRVVFLKLQVIIQYWLFGEVDFRTLLILGNLAYFGVVFVMIRQGQKLGFKRYQLIAIPYFLLSPVSSENMNFVGGQVYIWGILFTLLFFIALSENNLYKAILLYLLSIFTMAGGLLLFPIGCAFLILRKQWKQFSIFVILSSAFTLLYFYHYQRPAHLPLMQDSFLYFNQAVQTFFAFIGNALFSYEIALVIGVLAVIILVVIAVYSYDQDYFLFLMSIWLILNAAVVALGRSNIELGVGYLPPRYSVYSLISFAIIFMWGIKQTSSNPRLMATLPMVAAIMAISYYSLVLLIDNVGFRFNRERDIKITGLVSLAEYQRPDYLIYPDHKRAKGILEESKVLGTYDYNDVIISIRKPVKWLFDSPDPNSELIGAIDENNDLYLKGWALIPSAKSSDSDIYLYLKNNTHYIKIKSYTVLRPDVSSALGMPVVYDYSGYEVYLGSYAIPSGSYQLGVVVENKNQIAIHWEDELFISP